MVDAFNPNIYIYVYIHTQNIQIEKKDFIKINYAIN